MTIPPNTAFRFFTSQDITPSITVFLDPRDQLRLGVCNSGLHTFFVQTSRDPYSLIWVDKILRYSFLPYGKYLLEDLTSKQIEAIKNEKEAPSSIDLLKGQWQNALNELHDIFGAAKLTTEPNYT